MISGLYQRVRPLIIANFGALTLLTFALWDATERLPLVLWATTLGAWTLLRFVLARVYMLRDPPLSETLRWTLAFAGGSTIAGCLWGASVFFVGDLDTDNAKLVTAFLMAALSAAAIAGYTNSLLAFAGFVVPSLLPYSLRLVNLSGSPSLIIAMFVVFWGVLLWVMARHLNEGFRDSIALSLRNRNLADQLRFQRDRAEAASRAKSRFLGHMSHELRTPLNAVIGYADMITQKMLGPIGNETYESYARDIGDSGRHMLSMVDGILDLSAAESGGLKLDMRPTDLGVILANAIEATEETGAAKGLTLSCSLPDGLPPITGNADRLLQLSFIVIDNAVRYAPEGGVVGISVTLDEADRIELMVSDNGPGMSGDLVEAVTSPFAQLDGEDHLVRSPQADTDGGRTSPRLNLALAKLLVETHGGAFQIASQPGRGTTVTVRLPLAGPVDTPTARETQTPAAAAGEASLQRASGS